MARLLKITIFILIMIAMVPNGSVDAFPITDILPSDSLSWLDLDFRRGGIITNMDRIIRVVTPVPESSSFMLLGMCLAGFLGIRRRFIK